MTLEARKRLLDAAGACAAIAEFTRGKDFAAYQDDRMLRSAVERQFEIVGEAPGKATAVDASLEESIPDLPRVIGLRNRLIHGYDTVDDEIIWDVVQTKLPPLETELRRLLQPGGMDDLPSA